MAAARVQLDTPSERFSIALRSRSASPVSNLIGRDALMNGRFAPKVANHRGTGRAHRPTHHWRSRFIYVTHKNQGLWILKYTGK
jgi:hypothetical protein